LSAQGHRGAKGCGLDQFGRYESDSNRIRDQGLIGGAIGCAVVTRLFFIAPSVGLASNLGLMLQVSPSIAVTGLVVSLLGGAVAGYFPQDEQFASIQLRQ